MSVAFRDWIASTGNNINASTTIVGGSGALVVGDFVILELKATTTGAPTLAVPSGWMQLGSTLAPTSAQQSMLISKVLTSGDLGSSIGVTLDAAHNFSWLGGAWSGVDNTTPIPSGGVSYGLDSSAGTTHQVPSQTIPSGGGYWEAYGVGDRGSPSSSGFSASGGTLRKSVGNTTGSGVYAQAIADSNGALATGANAGALFTSLSGFSVIATRWSAILAPSGNVVANATAQVFGHWTQFMLNQALAAGTLKLRLMDPSYVFDRDNHTFWSDVSSHELPTANGYTAGGIAVSSPTVTYDATNHRAILTGGSVSWTPSPGSLAFSGGILVVDTGTAGTTRLMEFINAGGTVTSTTPVVFAPDPTDGYHYEIVAPGS